MRTPEMLTTRIRKKKRRKPSKFKQTKSFDNIDEVDHLKEDDSSSSCNSEVSVEDSELSTLTSEPESVYLKRTTMVAIDCEMVGVGEDKKSALARCSIVNYDGNVMYDNFIKPEEEITDYRTQWSGIRPADMVNAIPFRKARRKARRLLKGRVLVGHSLQSDLHVLKLKHPQNSMRDTAKYIPLRSMAGLYIGATPSLKTLTRRLLDTEIQTNEHCSVEDARASLSLYKLCENEWENELKETECKSYLGDAYWPSWTNTN